MKTATRPTRQSPKDPKQPWYRKASNLLLAAAALSGAVAATATNLDTIQKLFVSPKLELKISDVWAGAVSVNRIKIAFTLTKTKGAAAKDCRLYADTLLTYGGHTEQKFDVPPSAESQRHDFDILTRPMGPFATWVACAGAVSNRIEFELDKNGRIMDMAPP